MKQIMLDILQNSLVFRCLNLQLIIQISISTSTSTSTSVSIQLSRQISMCRYLYSVRLHVEIIPFYISMIFIDIYQGVKFPDVLKTKQGIRKPLDRRREPAFKSNFIDFARTSYKVIQTKADLITWIIFTIIHWSLSEKGLRTKQNVPNQILCRTVDLNR